MRYSKVARQKWHDNLQKYRFLGVIHATYTPLFRVQCLQVVTKGTIFGKVNIVPNFGDFGIIFRQGLTVSMNILTLKKGKK